MPRKLQFTFNGKVLELETQTTVQREELYGKAKRVIEKDGVPLLSGILTPDGRLFPRSAFTNLQVDHAGCLTEKPTAQNEDGSKAAIHADSFTEARPLEKIDETQAVKLSVESIIPIETDLSTTLKPGFYKTQYLYRTGPNIKDALILVQPKSEGGSFLLTGENRQSPLLGKQETYAFFDEEEEDLQEEEGEISFDMV